MKNQYVGDIGDYGIYALFQFLVNKGIKLGVNWYLTENDYTNDGKYTGYLNNEKYRKYDESLYDFLKTIASSSKKTVQLIEQSHMLGKDITFYHKILTYEGKEDWKERVAYRNDWHKEALQTLKASEIIFMDSDNGMIGAKSITSKDGVKYIAPKEVYDYYKRGQGVIYYNQRGRYKLEQWKNKILQMRELCPDAKIFAMIYRGGTQRGYIFVMHPEQERQIINMCKAFLNTNWKELFFLQE